MSTPTTAEPGSLAAITDAALAAARQEATTALAHRLRRVASAVDMEVRQHVHLLQTDWIGQAGLLFASQVLDQATALSALSRRVLDLADDVARQGSSTSEDAW